MSYTLCKRLQPDNEIKIEHIVVDTTSVSRDTLAKIFETWRDGYSGIIARTSTLTEKQVSVTLGWVSQRVCMILVD